MKLSIKKYKKWKRIDKWLQTIIFITGIIFCADLLSSQTITNVTLGILRIGNNATITSGQVLLPDGVGAAPSLSFSNNPTTGIYCDAALIRFGFGGAYRFGISNLAVHVSNVPLDIGGNSDVLLSRDAANTLALKNGNLDQTQRWYGSNSAYFQIKSVSEYLTIAAAASTDTAMSIPANAVVRGVAVYVAVAIPTAATFTVTGATSTTVFNTAAVGTGIGSNDVGTQNTPYKNGAAQLIRITPGLVPANNNGRVRVVLFYEIPSPPTS